MCSNGNRLRVVCLAFDESGADTRDINYRAKYVGRRGCKIYVKTKDKKLVGLV